MFGLAGLASDFPVRVFRLPLGASGLPLRAEV
jgi:hypothetical protein